MTKPARRPVRRRAPRPRGAFTFGTVTPPGFAQRALRVYTPPGHRADVPHPVLILFDGQNVFDDAPSFAGGWHADRAVEALGKARTRPIVVGLDNGGGARIDELAPWANRMSRGQGDAFLGWLAHAVLPSLRRRFAIVEGPVGVAIGGSSLGGLAALYAHFRYPEAFGAALAMSPSLWFANRAIFPFVRAQSTPWASRIYLDAGAREGGGAAARLAERLAHDLRARGYGPDTLLHKTDARGQHNERSWRRRLPAALRFLYR